jgi:hypothetical protein
MTRTISAMAAVGLLFSAFHVSAGTGGPPYQFGSTGKCHDSSGKFVKQSLCMAPSTATPPKHCTDPHTHKFVKCGAPGAAHA